MIAAPLAARAQAPAKIPRIEILSPAAEASTPAFEAFRQGLRALGYVEGQNIVLELRLAAGRVERLRELAAELVALVGLSPNFFKKEWLQREPDVCRPGTVLQW